MITTQPRQAQQPSPAVIERSIPDQMAERMLELGMNGTAVTADTLFEHTNFTRDEIKAHGAEAADIARARSVRQVS